MLEKLGASHERKKHFKCTGEKHWRGGWAPRPPPGHRSGQRVTGAVLAQRWERVARIQVAFGTAFLEARRAAAPGADSTHADIMMSAQSAADLRREACELELVVSAAVAGVALQALQPPSPA